MEISEETYLVISPTSGESVAKIIVRQNGLELLSGPDFTEPLVSRELFGQESILDFNRATRILQNDRLKAPPDFLAGQGGQLLCYETASNSAGDLSFQSQRCEVLPPRFIDTPITHAVEIIVSHRAKVIGRVSITGFLPLDGSPVKKQLVIIGDTEGLFRKEPFSAAT